MSAPKQFEHSRSIQSNMDIYCNECKEPFTGRKRGRLHGESSGHDWQPVFHCQGCKKGFKKNKLYNLHLPSCPAGSVIAKPQPTTASPTGRPTHAINIAHKFSTNAKPSVLSHPVTVIPVPPARVQHADASNSSSSPLDTACAESDDRVADTVSSFPAGDSLDQHAPCQHSPCTGSKAPSFDSPPSQTLAGGAARLGPSNGGCAGLEQLTTLPGGAMTSNNHREELGKNTTTTAALSWHCRSCLQDPCRDPVATLCGHIFCAACIIGWVQHSGSCPVCEKTFFVKLDVNTLV
ncbi:hypothetical protein C8Q79DRAFT_1009635 [Trametes meyenii]|nr:hypothetical protein C8Q79DRAFT_1009635 [Trametes meyenii]